MNRTVLWIILHLGLWPLWTMAQNDPAALLQSLHHGQLRVRQQALQRILTMKGKFVLRGLQVALQDDVSAQRLTAVKALGRRPEKGVDDLLAMALQDPAEEVRCAAIDIVGQRKVAKLLDALIAILRYSTVKARITAIATLVILRKPQAVAPLITALNYPAATIRRQAAQALASFKDRQALEPLVLRLGDPESAVRQAALRSLLKLAVLGPPPIKLLVLALAQKDLEGRRWAAEKLGELKATAGVPALCKALNDALPVKRAAIVALAKIGDQRAVLPLAALLSQPNDEIRAKVIAALVKLNDQRAGNALLQLLHEQTTLLLNDKFNRQIHIQLIKATVAALAHLQIASSYPSLLEVSQMHIGGVDVAAQKALGQLEHKVGRRTVPDAIKALTNVKPAIRRHAADFLAKLGGQSAIVPLIKAMEDRDALVRTKAAQALLAIEKRLGALPIDCLQTALQGKYVRTRLWAVQLLGKSGQPQAVAPLAKALRDPAAKVRSKAIAALVKLGDKRVTNSLVPLLHDKDQEVREQAVRALGVLGERRTIAPLLLRILTQQYRQSSKEAPNVVIAAIEVLAQKEELRAIEPFLTLTKYPALKDAARKAALHLQQKLGKALITPLLQALNSPEIHVRLQAADMLAKVGDPQLVPSMLPKLRAKLRDPAAQVKMAVIRTLTHFNDPGLMPYLLPRINDKDKWVRIGAIEALAELKATQAAASLLVVLEDKDEEVRAKAIEALGKLAYQPAVEPLASIMQNARLSLREKAFQALVQIGAPALPVFSRYLNSDDVWLRRKAAQGLLHLADPRSIGTLTQAVKDPDPAVRRTVMAALAKFSSQAVAGSFIQLLSSSDQATREKAAATLAGFARRKELKDPQLRTEVAKALTQALSDSSVTVKSAALQGLGYLQARTSAPAIAKLLHDPAPQVRRWSVWALEQLRDPTTTSAVLDLISDDNVEVRLSVVQAIYHLKPAKAVAKVVARLIQDPDPRVRAAAAHTLGVFGNDKAIKIITLNLNSSLQDSDLAVACAAAESLGRLGDRKSIAALQKALRGNQPALRAAAAVALQMMGQTQALRADEQLVQQLIQGLHHSDPLVQQWSIKAVGGLQIKSAVPALRRLLDAPNRRIRQAAAAAIAKIPGQRTISFWIKTLHAGDNEQQRQALKTLAAAGARQAVKDIQPLLMHADNDVRVWAAYALVRLGQKQQVRKIVQALLPVWRKTGKTYKTKKFGDDFRFVFQPECLLIFKEDRYSALVMALARQTPGHYSGTGFKLVKRSRRYTIFKSFSTTFKDTTRRQGSGEFVTTDGCQDRISWQLQ